LNTGSDNTAPLFNVKTFKGDYREVAEKIISEDTAGIRSAIVSNKLDVNFRDNKYGISILTFALENRKYLSCKKLLEMGSNPNQRDSDKELIPPITIAAGILDSSYLKLMLDYGGDPNVISNKSETVPYNTATPLNAAASTSLENVKLLISKGANLDLQTRVETYPLTTSLISNKIGIAHYLIFEKKADIFKVNLPKFGDQKKDTLKIADLLRSNVFPLDSKEYQLKMEIVDYLKAKGIDYRSTPIPEHYYKQFGKEYLERY
jgi:ankyrin repeat protein